MNVIDASTRVQLKKILFATDFSRAAAAAIPYAAALTRNYGATLYVVHVRPAADWDLHSSCGLAGHRERSQYRR
jgi:Universal stress protein family